MVKLAALVAFAIVLGHGLVMVVESIALPIATVTVR